MTPLVQLPSPSSFRGRVRAIDSHTEGEPTRVVFDGAPRLGEGRPEERLATLVSQHEPWRRAMVAGPRGSQGIVAALLLPPADPAAAAQVLYFNTRGPLPMCVHATIGLVETLRRYGGWDAEPRRLETVAGSITVRALDDGRVEVENVASSRVSAGVVVPTSCGTLVGDVAWGGNWFFVARDPENQVCPEHIERLHRMSTEALAHLGAHGFGEGDPAPVDHIYLTGSPEAADATWRSFVLCPDGNYDRSPCGTGTSAALACRAATGEVRPDTDVIVQSVTGTVFEARATALPDGSVRPTIRGRAHITAETTLVTHGDDPWGWPA